MLNGALPGGSRQGCTSFAHLLWVAGTPRVHMWLSRAVRASPFSGAAHVRHPEGCDTGGHLWGTQTPGSTPSWLWTTTLGTGEARARPGQKLGLMGVGMAAAGCTACSQMPRPQDSPEPRSPALGESHLATALSGTLSAPAHLPSTGSVQHRSFWSSAQYDCHLQPSQGQEALPPGNNHP